MCIKKTMFLLLLFLVKFSIAQDSSKIQLELKKHNLSWINPDSINQDEFSVTEIDDKIKVIIEKQISNKTLLVDMVVPFNEKKLMYLGFKHPNELNIFSKNQITTSNACELNSKVHIYKYDNFYISTEEDEKFSQENIYYTLRAINILKYRYNEAYSRLLLNTFSTIKTKPSTGFSYLNSNKAIWVGFNYNPTAIAANRTYLILDGYTDSNKTIDLYQNISVVNIHSNNILGKSSIGSKPIYKKSDSNINRENYLKEGLLESIIHEMLHNYIDYSHSALPEYNAIYKMRGMNSFNNFEENIVLNTSLSYFYKKGGFSNYIKDFYYTNTFDININSLKNQNLLESYFKSVFNKAPSDIKSEMKMQLLE